MTTGSMIITTSSVLPEECLSSRIYSTMLEWVAWQQLWHITLISHSLQITVHNVFVLSACDMMMAWYFFLAEKSHISWWYSNNYLCKWKQLLMYKIYTYIYIYIYIYTYSHMVCHTTECVHYSNNRTTCPMTQHHIPHEPLWKPQILQYRNWFINLPS